jgi:aminopeptidase YwaD
MQSSDLWTDFQRLCGFGGRLQGTPGCDAAFDFVKGRLGALGEVQEAPTQYHGWTLDALRVTAEGAALPALALIGSAATDGEVALEILDLGRGTPEDVAAAGPAVRGRAVMVRHEYTFAPRAIHRRYKLRAAAEAGAAAVILVQPIPGVGAVSGWANACPIPVIGMGIEAATRLAFIGRGRFLLQARHHLSTARNLVLDLVGGGPGRVVLSAHLDGHAPAESAIDNATGVAALLALARDMARRLPDLPRGLTVCVFGAEEWSLSGSRAWLRGLPEEQTAAMIANLNLDSITGSPNLTALTSGFPGLSDQMRRSARVAVHEPLLVSSDHASFAAHGVPALRLMAGFGEADSLVSRILTGADTRALVHKEELVTATDTAGALLAHLLSLPGDQASALRQGAADARPAVDALADLPGGSTS